MKRVKEKRERGKKQILFTLHLPFSLLYVLKKNNN